MIRVGLARTEPHYGGVSSPFDPGKDYPELSALLGDLDELFGITFDAF